MRPRLFLLAAIAILGACHRNEEKPAAALPSRDAFAGSASCRECHEEKYDAWSHDWHARALSKAAPEVMAGRFENAHFRGASSEAWMQHAGDRYIMRTRNREGEPRDYDVAWLIGGKRMQDTVTVFPDGRWQVLPVYFHVTGGGAWVDYNEAKQGTVTADHPYFWTNFRRTANKECLDCHATGVNVRYDRDTHQWSTSFADAGVACEACHGPGARHAATKSKNDIIHPADVSDAQEMAICGSCHGPREPLFPILDARDRFRPGQLYEERYQPLVIVDGPSRSGEYFADGRPSSSSFEYQALLQSRCSLEGKATCLTCHSAPHEKHIANEVKRGVDASCVDCHSKIGADAAAHSHHRAARCIDCHMPPVVSGVLDKFADHTIDVPNVENTIRHGVPNACGVCHADKNPEVLARSLSAWWPNAATRNARRVRLADAIDERTADRSLPALTAVVRDRAEAPILRAAAALLMAQRFPSSAAAILAPIADEPDPLLRARTIEALATTRDRSAVAVAARFVNDPSLQVRETAVLALASARDPRAEPELRKLAGDPATATLFRPHVMLSIAAANRGDFDTAMREIDAALAQAPYVADAIVFRADILARRGDFPAAKSELEEALRFDPRHRGAIARLRSFR
ncbi:MAG TPA: HEAT repeat domain-containing protein [Thermoanaerobaculia bacterium]|nr:HEAT repeat domain-containing protein [Thermoanaerobaculia bacterium]